MSIKLISEKDVILLSAGQVLRNYDDIIKELLENSIDAEASRIEVFIDYDEIKIKDNGIGMSYDDLSNSVKKNYTSKITKIDDLQNLNKLGFRGEALYFINETSNLVIYSKKKEDNIGFCFENNQVNESVCSDGTTVIVTDIFKKVNKKDFIKFNIEKIKEMVEIYSLSHKIDFIFKTKRNTFFFDGNIKKILLVDNLIHKSDEFDDIKIDLYFSKEFSLKNKQFIFVNRRPIFDKTISAILNSWYQNLVGNKNFNFCLFLNIKPNKLDVNINPSKTEVFFNINTKNVLIQILKNLIQDNSLKENYIENKNYILNNLNNLDNNNNLSNLDNNNNLSNLDNNNLNSLDNNNNLSNLDNNNLNSLNNNNNLNNLDNNNNNLNNLDNNNLNSLNNNNNLNNLDNNNNLSNLNNISSKNISNSDNNVSNLDNQLNLDDIFSLDNKSFNLNNLKNHHSINNFFSKKTCNHESKIGNNIIGQVFNKYIVSSDDFNVYFIDQHAADERIIMNRYIKKDFVYQKLNQPIVIDKNGFSHSDLFKYVELNNNILITDIAHFFDSQDINDFLNGKILSEEEYFRSFGCRNAIKAGKKLSLYEMEILIDSLNNTPNSSICNHGRKTYYKISLSELDKIFSR